MANPTRIQDVIDSEVLADQIGAKYPDFLVLGNTNLVEVDSTFPLGSPGSKFKMPFWKRIGSFATLSEGSAVTPGRIMAGSEFAVVQRAALALEVLDTASLVSKADPMSEIASQIGRRAAEFIDAALVTEAEKTPNTYDQSGVSGGTMDQDVLVTAMINTLGDNYSAMLAGGAYICHSKVLGDLLKLDVIQNQYQSGMDVLRTGVVPTLMGLPVIVSDRVTVATVSSVNYYNSYIVGPGALALFYQQAVNVEFDRDTLSFADIISASVHFAPHMFGWDDDAGTQAAEDAKSIHIVKIKSK